MLRHFLVNNLVYSIKELYELMKNESFCKLTRLNYKNYEEIECITLNEQAKYW